MLKTLKNKKWFTLVELIVSIALTTILSTIVFNWIQSIVKAQYRDKFYRSNYSTYSEWLTKGQKMIFENATTLSWTFNTVTTSWSVLSFSKEDSYWIERTYFLNLDTTCTTPTNTIGTRFVITDWISDPIRLTGCLFPDKFKIEQEVKVINTDIKEKIVNFYIYITDTSDNTKTTLKNTFFVK